MLHSDVIYNCDEHQSDLVWHYYVAMTYDGGDTWEVHKMSTDPVQVGGIYDVVVDGSGSCRNLLDFQDMDIDSEGRIHVGWADGCIDACATASAKQAANETGYRANAPRVFRQVGGRGLFAQADGVAVPTANDADGDGIIDAEDPDADGDGVADAGTADTPALGVLPLLAVVALALVLRRRE
jgi:MYXO-CTERM domain-containing protein